MTSESHTTEASASGSSIFQLTLFSLVMLGGSYLAGSAPLIVSLSEEKLQRISVLGAGLLVGTALAVIIPEGVQTLLHSYTSKGNKAHEDLHEMEGLDKAIGFSLVLGFVFMLLIDQLAKGRSSSNSDIDSEIQNRNTKSSVSWTTTLGLVVHAAADGIALGAAATTNQTDVEIIVFLAIMLHKAPAAFGLTTFLLHEGLDRLRVRRHLLIFSFSAPLTAILTFLLLHPSHSSSDIKGNFDTLHATGIAMLFSAGTFLYVATVHVLPEIVSGSQSSHSNGHSHQSGSFSKCDLLLLVIGSFLPLLLTLGHHH